MVVHQKPYSGDIKMSQTVKEGLILNGRDRTYEGRITLVSEEEITLIMDLEHKTNIPEIRASRDIILYRFSRGMKMFGFWIDGKLVSSLGFTFRRFFPDRPNELPETFEEYTNPDACLRWDFNSICTNGFNIDYDLRKEGIGSVVAKSMIDVFIEQGKACGCVYGLADPRLHTYNGCNHPPIEVFRQDPKVKDAVDKAMSGERKFTLKDLLRDPEFRVYHRLTGEKTKIVKLMPKTWFPQDYPSGGHGVYVYLDLRT